MAKRQLLSADPHKRVKIILAEEDGKHYIETRQDCEHIIEAAKVLAEVPPDPESGFRFVCAIPDVVWNDAVVNGWLHDKKRWREWAKNPDNRGFNGGRTNPF
jgi:hypothetical protein